MCQYPKTCPKCNSQLKHAYNPNYNSWYIRCPIEYGHYSNSVSKAVAFTYPKINTYSVITITL